VADTWANRDLPVLKAIVKIFELDGAPISVTAICHQARLDKDTVQRAIQALYAEPYLQREGRMTAANGGVVYAGAPTGDALRAVGNWPTPESLIDRLASALEKAGDDNDRPTEERSKLRNLALGMRGFGYQVAIGALGGAGGNLLS
jgi:predicted transcriptional regulator